jgi:hypothetical protein
MHVLMKGKYRKRKEKKKARFFCTLFLINNSAFDSNTIHRTVAPPQTSIVYKLFFYYVLIFIKVLNCIFDTFQSQFSTELKAKYNKT